MRSRAAASSNASSASVCADPTCSTCSTCRPRRVTTWTATAPEAVRTLRTNRETTPEGFHDGVLSDHIAPDHKTNQQISDLPSHPDREGGTSQVMCRSWPRVSLEGAPGCAGVGYLRARG